MARSTANEWQAFATAEPLSIVRCKVSCKALTKLQDAPDSRRVLLTLLTTLDTQCSVEEQPKSPLGGGPSFHTRWICL